ncbi:MAG: homoserine kinase [Pseudomonadota bacterium]
MAVYTHIAAEDMTTLVQRFGAGRLISAKGIAEGVENSNYLVETDQGRFIFTIYEKRVDTGDLPFFLSLIDHLVAKGCPVPRALKAEGGAGTISVDGKAMAMMEFMPGLSVAHPTAAQAHAVGEALGTMHKALVDFAPRRTNSLGPEGWYDLAARCGDDLDTISSGLKARVTAECAFLRTNWPSNLPQSVIHADLFPDNVLMVGDTVGAMIDFYFACTEIRAWDVAVTHASWSFEGDGTGYNPAVGDGIIAGYAATFGMSDAEHAAFAVLARGACLRFLLTRAWDWLHTPADAIVTRKDPLAFLRRLEHYAAL